MLVGTHVGADCAAAEVVRPANPRPRASNGPRTRARIDGMDPKQDMRLDRRTFLKRGAIAGGVLAGAGLGIKALAEADGDQQKNPQPALDRTAARPAPARPNILVIMVDQLRFPQWFGASAIGLRLPPNLQRLRRGRRVASGTTTPPRTIARPSRAAMLTGLYTHQTGCMITGGSTLDPGFPTWGTMLREHGYHTRWLGKWHLTHDDNHWTPAAGEEALERYGFAGGIYPSPDGGPGQGWHEDPRSHATSPNGSAKKQAPSPGARPSPSSTRTTSPGGTYGATGFRPRPRRGAPSRACHPTSRRPKTADRRAASRACSARFRTRPRPRSGRCPSPAPKRS